MNPVRCRHCGIAHPRGTMVCPVTRLAMTVGRPPIPAAPQLPRQAPKPVPRSLVGRVVGDRYGVTGLIGTGGIGAVYEAEHLAIGRVVAVKVLQDRHAQDKEAVARLRHEARVAGTLGHPNICAIYDMGRLEDGSPYLVMERLHGETLAQRLKRRGTLNVGDALDLALQVLSALVAAHHKGIIHRDLKPENIFLSRRDGMRPVPKLLDFGISKTSAIDDSVSDIKGMATPAGTPYYLAPEQARGERNTDHRVDLWAAGVVLYEMLAGRRPFVARNYNALLVQILTQTPRPVREVKPGLSPLFDSIILRALAKMPEDRFQTAEEFLGALSRFKTDEQPPSVRPHAMAAEESSSDDKTTVFRRGDELDSAALRARIPATAPVERSPKPRTVPAPVKTPRMIPSAPQIPAVGGAAPRPVVPKLYEDDESTVVDPPSFPDPSFSDTATTLRRDDDDGPKAPPNR